MRKTLKQQMDESLLELKQAQKRYEQKTAQFNEQEKKARNKRIAERGAMVEKKLPELALLDKERFNAYVEKVMASDFARKVFAELTATPATQNPADTARSGGANGDSHTGQTSQSGRA